MATEKPNLPAGPYSSDGDNNLSSKPQGIGRGGRPCSISGDSIINVSFKPQGIGRGGRHCSISGDSINNVPSKPQGIGRGALHSSISGDSIKNVPSNPQGIGRGALHSSISGDSIKNVPSNRPGIGRGGRPRTISDNVQLGYMSYPLNKNNVWYTMAEKQKRSDPSDCSITGWNDEEDTDSSDYYNLTVDSEEDSFSGESDASCNHIEKLRSRLEVHKLFI